MCIFFSGWEITTTQFFFLFCRYSLETVFLFAFSLLLRACLPFAEVSFPKLLLQGSFLVLPPLLLLLLLLPLLFLLLLLAKKLFPLLLLLPFSCENVAKFSEHVNLKLFPRMEEEEEAKCTSRSTPTGLSFLHPPPSKRLMFHKSSSPRIATGKEIFISRLFHTQIIKDSNAFFKSVETFREAK